MRITLVHIESFMNLGGILPNLIEQYKWYKKLGHTVRLITLTTHSAKYNVVKNINYYRNHNSLVKQEFDKLEEIDEIFFNQCEIAIPLEHTILFNNQEDITLRDGTVVMGFKSYLKICKETDMLIFTEPFVTMNKTQVGSNEDFPKIYTMPKLMNPYLKLFISIYDIHLQRGYAWIVLFEKYIDGVLCAHHSAYRIVKSILNVPVLLVYLPFDVENTINPADDPFEKRSNAIFNCSWYKSWKRMDQYVRMAPYLIDAGFKTLVAGGGLEKSYMTSETKLKDSYIWKDNYKGSRPEFVGKPIFKVATDYGMIDYNWVSFANRNKIQRKIKYGFDSSYQNPVDDYAKSKGHYNRTQIEFMINGCVPIVRDFGFSYNDDGSEGLFGNKTAVILPSVDHPVLLVNILVQKLKNIDLVESIRKHNYENILPMMSSKEYCTRIIKFYHKLNGAENVVFNKYELLSLESKEHLNREALIKSSMLFIDGCKELYGSDLKRSFEKHGLLNS